CLLACAVLCSFHRGTGNARFASQALDRLSLFGSLLHTAVPSKPLRVAPTPPYSWRSTAFGSRRDARRAGAYAPSAAAATNPAVTSTTKGRLNDGTPTAAVTALLASRQSTRPIDTPAAPSAIPCFITIPSTPERAAPIAMRIPISRARRLTEYDMRP